MITIFLLAPMVFKQEAQRIEQISRQNEPQSHSLQQIKLIGLTAGAAQNAASTNYQTAAEAQRTRNEIILLLETAKHLAGYELYEALDDVQVFFAAEMKEIIRKLPEEQRIKISENEPLLALVHRSKGKAVSQIPNPFFPEEYEVRYV